MTIYTIGETEYRELEECWSILRKVTNNMKMGLERDQLKQVEDKLRYIALQMQKSQKEISFTGMHRIRDLESES